MASGQHILQMFDIFNRYLRGELDATTTVREMRSIIPSAIPDNGDFALAITKHSDDPERQKKLDELHAAMRAANEQPPN